MRCCGHQPGSQAPGGSVQCGPGSGASSAGSASSSSPQGSGRTSGRYGAPIQATHSTGSTCTGGSAAAAHRQQPRAGGAAGAGAQAGEEHAACPQAMATAGRWLARAQGRPAAAAHRDAQQARHHRHHGSEPAQHHVLYEGAHHQGAAGQQVGEAPGLGHQRGGPRLQPARHHGSGRTDQQRHLCQRPQHGCGRGAGEVSRAGAAGRGGASAPRSAWCWRCGQAAWGPRAGSLGPQGSQPGVRHCCPPRKQRKTVKRGFGLGTEAARAATSRLGVSSHLPGGEACRGSQGAGSGRWGRLAAAAHAPGSQAHRR